MTAPVCMQCESNARSNEAGGHLAAAEECRAYCRRGHVSVVAFAVRQAATHYASNARHSNSLRDLIRAYEEGYRTGVRAAAHGAIQALPDEDTPPKVES